MFPRIMALIWSCLCLEWNDTTLFCFYDFIVIVFLYGTLYGLTFDKPSYMTSEVKEVRILDYIRPFNFEIWFSDSSHFPGLHNN